MRALRCAVSQSVWVRSSSSTCSPQLQHRVQRRHRLLEHHAHAGAAQLAQPLVGDGALAASGSPPSDHVARSDASGPVASSPITVVASTDLPEPDSPTMQSVSAGLQAQVQRVRSHAAVGVGRQADLQAAYFEDRRGVAGSVAFMVQAHSRWRIWGPARRAGRHPAG